MAHLSRKILRMDEPEIYAIKLSNKTPRRINPIGNYRKMPKHIMQSIVDVR